MVFSSLEFLCVFLPVVFILYCIVRGQKARNAILILASLVFYAFGEPVYILLMLASICANYLLALGIAKSETHKKAVLAVAVAANLGALAVFKYAGFLVGTVVHLFSADIPVPDLALPIGISFFTFQALSYVIDVYRGQVDAQHNFAKVMLYISFFPQLIAGPIVRYKDIFEEINDRHMDRDQVVQGLQRFILGLGKKVLIANAMGAVADAVYAADAGSVNMGVAWLGAVAYMLQIYFDFSGYSDMAIGLGRMFGFHFRENFLYPYGSVGIKDFWHRWHISLSTWFKEYLYIPLGGNRKGPVRTCVNRIIVFACTGLWHGASWNFVLWGLWHGLFLLLEDYVKWFKRIPKLILRIYTLLVVCLGFVLFRADTLSQAGFMIRQMFTGVSFTAQSVSFLWQQLTPWTIAMLLAAVVFAAPIRPLMNRVRARLWTPSPFETKESPEKEGKNPAWQSGEKSGEQERGGAEKASRRLTVLRGVSLILCVLLLVWCLIRLSGGTYNPFIYFRF